jgi:hypothetical protein
MISRPMHSRVIMPAAITGRDSTARYSAMHGPTAAWRAMAQGGPHQEAMAISLSGETFTVEAMEIAKTEGCRARVFLDRCQLRSYSPDHLT